MIILHIHIKADDKKGFQNPEYKSEHPYHIPIYHFFPKRLFVLYCQIIILTKLPLTNWMKNKSHWKFKAQHYHVFITVSVCLKYGLLTGCLSVPAHPVPRAPRPPPPEENKTTHLGRRRQSQKPFTFYCVWKVVLKLSDLVWKSVPADSEVDNPLSLKDRESHIKNFTPKPLKITLKRKRRGGGGRTQHSTTSAYIWIN